MLKYYNIKHVERDDYWITRLGWSPNKQDATTFTSNDRQKYPLPPFGEWVLVHGTFGINEVSEPEIA